MNAIIWILILSGLLLLVSRTASAADIPPRLFPDRLPPRDWVHFEAHGYSQPVCGVVYSNDDTVTNGMPLGGVDTGCIDLETSGLFGYCTLFNTHVPRRGPLNLPYLGVSTGGKTWVCCNPARLQKGEGAWQDGKQRQPLDPVPDSLNLGSCLTPSGIRYWGHYPIADIEFDLDGPITVGLRAWSPFLPGCLVDSMMPAAAFDVYIRNTTQTPLDASLGFSFPGPSPREANYDKPSATEMSGPLQGLMIAAGGLEYAVGTDANNRVRSGNALEGDAWNALAHALPGRNTNDYGAALAVDITLKPNECRRIRFILAWHAPVWHAAGCRDDSGTTHAFRHMYALHYPNAEHTATAFATHADDLLRRIIAWQEAIYTDGTLPVWLRDGLINVLHLITEDGLWAQAGPPLPDWVRPEDGLWGMNECPRGCPQIECIPCSFYGSLPLTYFFPELQLSTLRGYKNYQFDDGAPPWVFGGCTTGTPPIDFANPARGYQFASNGISLAGILDRFLLCRDTPDHAHLREFYPMLKHCMEWILRLRSTPAYSTGQRVIAMPDPDSQETLVPPTEWFEAREPGWFGVTAHIGGLRLAQLRITERAARLAADHAFAEQCALWIQEGVQAMEQNLWTGSYYLNCKDPESGDISDFIFGYQLDGEWIIAHHGLPNALPMPHIRETLNTITRCNVALTRYGAVNYANPDGSLIRPAKEGTWDYGQFSFFPPEALMLAMTYIYNGQKSFGLDVARRLWHNIVCLQGYTWDMPNIIRGDSDSGERSFGNDYYQDMILWSLPASVLEQDLSAPAKPGGLVDRIIRAAAGAPVNS